MNRVRVDAYFLLRHGAPLGLLALYVAAFNAINRWEPQETAVVVAATASLLLGVGVAVALVQLGRAHVRWLVAAAVPSLVLWAHPMWVLFTNYDQPFQLFPLFDARVLPFLFVPAHALVVVLAALAGGRYGWPAMHGLVAGWSLGFALAAVVNAALLLATLEQQVEAARQTPGPGVVLVLVAVAAAALARRRS